MTIVMSSADTQEPTNMDILNDSQQKPLIPATCGYVGIIVMFIFFQVLAWLISIVGPPESLLPTEDFWKWRNLVISWVHAAVITVWDLSCFYFYPDLTTDLILYYNLYIYLMVVFSSAYFLHDFADIIVNGHSKDSWEVLLHHIALVTIFIYNLIYCQCIAYCVIALFAEVNTIFLHTRKLFQLHGVPFESWPYRINSLINLITFLSCRFVCIIWIAYGVLFWSYRVSIIFRTLASCSLVVMIVINIILFWRLLNNDLLRPLTLYLNGENIDVVAEDKGVGNGRSHGKNCVKNGIGGALVKNGGSGGTKDGVVSSIGGGAGKGEGDCVANGGGVLKGGVVGGRVGEVSVIGRRTEKPATEWLGCS